MESLSDLMPIIDILAVIVFAASGALVASRQGLDVLGFMWLAVLAGVGGGTVRDLILDVPVFWLSNPTNLTACLITAVIAHFIAPLVESRSRLLLWFDALGLALFTIAGTAKGLDFGHTSLVAIVMGVITGSVGGIARDIVGGQPSVIMRHEIYVTASVLGACCYVLLMPLVSPLTATVAGFLVTFVIRSLAIAYNLSLPVWRRKRTGSVTDTDAHSK